MLFIKDMELFVLAGDIDTYIYLLFLKIGVYFMFVLTVINVAILCPVYYMGKTDENYHSVDCD